MSPQGRKIACIGASGNIGSMTLPALLAKKVHTITVVQRPESKGTYAAEVTVKTGPLDDEAFLAQAFAGQDVVLVQLSVEAMQLEKGIIQAAAKAGVPYILPAEFGSDPEAKLVDELFVLQQKRERRQLAEQLGVSAWIGVITNPWLEFCLGGGVLAIHVKERRAVLYDGGNTKFVTTTLGRVGAAVAELLSLPEEQLATYRNRPFYVSSFHVTQRELLEAVLRQTGTTEAEWTIETPSCEDVEQQWGDKLKQGDMGGFLAMFPMLHFREGYGGDYQHKVDNAKFGFAEEDLDQVVQGVVKQVEGA
ncbi:hypothetical protein S40293_05237 [Stachybotrys chartarum IBT 40293]|nr:hypothetical protein S40293_05237 [Stachybotrys chartarum IBT 40293]KFA71567.1 hypothetical protein S40288_08857 [Stachybotrys chartarum IBT 40288]